MKLITSNLKVGGWRGVFGWLLWLFLGYERKPRCAAFYSHAWDSRCVGLADPRCLGGNCTKCCNELCKDRCRHRGWTVMKGGVS